MRVLPKISQDKKISALEKKKGFTTHCTHLYSMVHPNLNYIVLARDKMQIILNLCPHYPNLYGLKSQTVCYSPL